MEEIAACYLCDEYGYAGGYPCHHNAIQYEITRQGIALVRKAIEEAKKGKNYDEPKTAD